jgi:hypothetical protein
MRDAFYVGRVPEFEIKDGVMCIDYGDWSVHMPLRIFKLAQVRANGVVREHTDRAAEIVPMRGGR